MTTGSSALQAADVIREHGAEIVAVLTLVDREEGGREKLEEAGLRLIAAFRGLELLEAAKNKG